MPELNPVVSLTQLSIETLCDMLLRIIEEIVVINKKLEKAKEIDNVISSDKNLMNSPASTSAESDEVKVTENPGFKASEIRKVKESLKEEPFKYRYDGMENTKITNESNGDNSSPDNSSNSKFVTKIDEKEKKPKYVLKKKSVDLSRDDFLNFDRKKMEDIRDQKRKF